ncbi:acetylxylan esterase [Streptomyces sp. CB02400]|uniref:acetylxylan esterase n=1 Tax=Streptomyces sp. CB02400 TaxID=1703944 RepID=UPI00093D6407|nr:acetylxylan esterase [Streptomyces sp. CB02400]OKK13880.1 acetyl xylan esterase [Streptomyces sp. CB02400]
MPLTDLPLGQLRVYDAALAESSGFDAFWQDTLAQARAAAEPHPTVHPGPQHSLTAVDVYDVRFPGWRGRPVAAWLLLPHGAKEPLPTVVTYIGYSGGRGLPTDHLLFPCAGYAQLVVDSRGQGHDTPDHGEGPGTQWVEGFMTRGIDDPRHHHYCRRLITDCVRAVDCAPGLPHVDADRIVVQGASQGGGLALAVAGLAGEQVATLWCDVPFLCHFRRGADIASDGPYVELARYLCLHTRDQPERAFATLNHFDGVHFAARATAPALFSVGLMDPVCPPSTIYASYNRYAGLKDIRVWPYGDHGGGYGSSSGEHLHWLRHTGLSPLKVS